MCVGRGGGAVLGQGRSSQALAQGLGTDGCEASLLQAGTDAARLSPHPPRAPPSLRRKGGPFNPLGSGKPGLAWPLGRRVGAPLTRKAKVTGTIPPFHAGRSRACRSGRSWEPLPGSPRQTGRQEVPTLPGRSRPEPPHSPGRRGCAGAGPQPPTGERRRLCRGRGLREGARSARRNLEPRLSVLPRLLRSYCHHLHFAAWEAETHGGEAPGLGSYRR